MRHAALRYVKRFLCVTESWRWKSTRQWEEQTETNGQINMQEHISLEAHAVVLSVAVLHYQNSEPNHNQLFYVFFNVASKRFTFCLEFIYVHRRRGCVHTLRQGLCDCGNCNCNYNLTCAIKAAQLFNRLSDVCVVIRGVCLRVWAQLHGLRINAAFHGTSVSEAGRQARLSSLLLLCLLNLAAWEHPASPLPTNGTVHVPRSSKGDAAFFLCTQKQSILDEPKGTKPSKWLQARTQSLPTTVLYIKLAWHIMKNITCHQGT